MIFSRFKKKREGFTMIEMILTLMILSICTLLLSRIAYIISRYDLQDERNSDEIAVLQLQLMVAQGSAYSVDPDTLFMRYHGEDVQLLQYQDKLVKRPGYEVILQQLDQVSFNKIDTCIYIEWKRNDTDEKALLTCE